MSYDTWLQSNRDYERFHGLDESTKEPRRISYIGIYLPGREMTVCRRCMDYYAGEFGQKVYRTGVCDECGNDLAEIARRW